MRGSEYIAIPVPGTNRRRSDAHGFHVCDTDLILTMKLGHCGKTSPSKIPRIYY